MDSFLQFWCNGKMPVFKFYPSDDHTVITSLGINECSDSSELMCCNPMFKKALCVEGAGYRIFCRCSAAGHDPLTSY